MKTTLLLLCASLAWGTNAQTARTSTASGDFLNPLNWSPVGVPASGDQLTINHNMIISTGIYYTAGSITINSGGSLMEDATDRDFWVDGTGSLINHGTFKSHTFLASPNTTVYNYGTFSQIDSIWNQSDLINIGVLEVFAFLNDEQASFTNEGQLVVGNNYNNQGRFNNKPWASIDVQNDFSNCNIQNLDAVYTNDGIFCIGNNMSNCLGDTLRGNGHYYIGNAASNFGVLEGNATFYTPSGSFAITGTTGSGVTITTGSCALLTESIETSNLNLYPNPAENLIHIDRKGKYSILSLDGRIIQEDYTEGTVDVSNMQSGVYILIFNGQRKQFSKL